MLYAFVEEVAPHPLSHSLPSSSALPPFFVNFQAFSDTQFQFFVWLSQELFNFLAEINSFCYMLVIRLDGILVYLFNWIILFYFLDGNMKMCVFLAVFHAPP